MWAFGYASWAWRLVPALAGTLLAPVFFFLARRALGSERAALLASLLLLADGVYLVQSRIAMTNIFAVLFQCAAALAVLREGPRERLSAGGMSLVGLALGLALSTRWTSAGAFLLLGLVWLALRGRRLLRPRELLLSLLAFVVVPVGIYATSYLPLVMRGQLRVADPAPNPFRTRAELVRGARQLWEEQEQVWRYHANLDATHPYFSQWYTWPWLLPADLVLLRAEGRFRPRHRGHGQPRPVVAVGARHPLVAADAALRARDPRRLFAGPGFRLLLPALVVAPRAGSTTATICSRPSPTHA